MENGQTLIDNARIGTIESKIDQVIVLLTKLAKIDDDSLLEFDSNINGVSPKKSKKTLKKEGGGSGNDYLGNESEANTPSKQHISQNVLLDEIKKKIAKSIKEREKDSKDGKDGKDKEDTKVNFKEENFGSSSLPKFGSSKKSRTKSQKRVFGTSKSTTDIPILVTDKNSPSKIILQDPENKIISKRPKTERESKKILKEKNKGTIITETGSNKDNDNAQDSSKEKEIEKGKVYDTDKDEDRDKRKEKDKESLKVKDKDNEKNKEDTISKDIDIEKGIDKEKNKDNDKDDKDSDNENHKETSKENTNNKEKIKANKDGKAKDKDSTREARATVSKVKDRENKLEKNNKENEKSLDIVNNENGENKVKKSSNEKMTEKNDKIGGTPKNKEDCGLETLSDEEGELKKGKSHRPIARVTEKRKQLQRTVHAQSFAIPLPAPELLSIQILPLNDELISKVTLDTLKANARGRIDVVCELLEKEQDYLRYLCILFHVFKVPMVAAVNKLSITAEQISIAFSNIEEIIKLHIQLLEALLTKFRSWSDTQTIGEVFLIWLPTVVDPYKHYASQYNDSLRMWDDMKERELVRQFLEQCSSSEHALNLDVGALTIKPIQRITRDYSMILERLVRCTPSTHTDYQYLTLVCENLKSVTTAINAATSELHFPDSSENSLSPSTTGDYIYKKGANVRNWKYRFMKVETDTGELAYYKTIQRKEKKGSIPLIEISDVKPVIYTDKNNVERKFVFHVVTPERTYYMQCNNAVQRSKWIETIEKARATLTKSIF